MGNHTAKFEVVVVFLNKEKSPMVVSFLTEKEANSYSREKNKLPQVKSAKVRPAN